MAEREISYKDLARVLKDAKNGKVYSVGALTSRVSRGTFTLEFLFEVADALELEVKLVPRSIDQAKS
jgi:hypothetical protein